jgi:hypothetical protein
VTLTGIEISAEAIKCAQRSAQMMGLEKVQFAALDYAAEQIPHAGDRQLLHPLPGGGVKRAGNLWIGLEEDLRQYSAGTYGDSGRGAGDCADASAVAGRKF